VGITCGLSVLYALVVWWIGTGLLLWLVRLHPRTYFLSVAGSTAVLALALYGLAATSANMSATGAYVAFTCAILVWAWPEMALLTGWLTGPWRHPCPPHSRGWRRISCAIRAILYHEFALAGAGAAVLGLTWGAPNQVGSWTFAVLWVMRLSAKLNLFLGVRFFNDELLPDHLRYLKSFAADRPINFLFMVSVTGATAAATIIATQLWTSDGTAHPLTVIGCTLLVTLLVLAILEHWFLVLPFPVVMLWRWWLRLGPKQPGHANAEPPRFALKVSASRSQALALDSSGYAVARGAWPLPSGADLECEPPQEGLRKDLYGASS